MIPPKTDVRWTQMIDGSIQHKFRCVPAGLMLSRVRREMAMDRSAAALERIRNEVFSFFQRYESILSEDISAVFGKGA